MPTERVTVIFRVEPDATILANHKAAVQELAGSLGGRRLTPIFPRGSRTIPADGSPPLNNYFHVEIPDDNLNAFFARLRPNLAAWGVWQAYVPPNARPASLSITPPSLESC